MTEHITSVWEDRKAGRRKEAEKGTFFMADKGRADRERKRGREGVREGGREREQKIYGTVLVVEASEQASGGNGGQQD